MKVGISGMYNFVRVRNNNDLRHFGTGVTIEDLVKQGLKADQIWVLPSLLQILVSTKDMQTSYLFWPGHITDLASVPKFLRSLVDNDGLRIIAAALVHDYNFATQEMGFRASNRLFYKMIRAIGGSWWLATKAWLGVSGLIGYYFYKKYNSGRALQCKETCTVTIKVAGLR